MESAFPEMKIMEKADSIEFSGRFVINISQEELDIKIAPKMLIVFPKKYPAILPKSYSLEKRIKWTHIYPKTNELCVATDFDLIVSLSKSKSIKDYIESFLLPYFVSYEYWRKTGKPLFGDRSHGYEGIFESLGDYFKLSSKQEYLLTTLFCWAAKKRRFINLFPKDSRKIIQKKYSEKIANLRKVGIVELRRLYKSIFR
jgi:hypothetical protein